MRQKPGILLLIALVLVYMSISTSIVLASKSNKAPVLQETSSGGAITLVVTVDGLKANHTPIDIVLIKDGVETSVQTVTNSSGVTTATFGTKPGSCSIKGTDVPGYLTPSEKTLTLRGNQKNVSEVLKYVSQPISVQNVELKSELKLIKGYSEQLEAKITPANALTQSGTWQSSDDAVATVINGLVLAKDTGVANITVKADEATATCKVTVVAITSLTAPEDRSALKGEVVTLPKTVVATLSDHTTKELAVTWQDSEGAVVGTTFQVPQSGQPGQAYTLTGVVQNTELTVPLTINSLDGGHAIPVQSIDLDVHTLSLFVGATSTPLIATINPDQATLKQVEWDSSNESVATVENGTVTARAPGIATISVRTLDGNLKAYCVVNVALAPEIALIFPTTLTGTTAITDFTNPGDVYLDVQNLIKGLPLGKKTYHVKVEQKGMGESILLGEGTVELTKATDAANSTQKFNVYTNLRTASSNYTEAGFDLASTNANRYFLSLSADPTYPRGEEQTLETNFTLGAAVPTIPLESIKVQTTITGGPRSNPDGIIFLLCRELDKPPLSEVTWKDYYSIKVPTESSYDPYGPGEFKVDIDSFSDEVKLKGTANEAGLVIWDKPAESIKLGGYVLLEVTPKDYADNLNLVNPESEDNALMKAVSLKRDGSIDRSVNNIYSGVQAQATLQLSETGISLYLDGLVKGQQQLLATLGPGSEVPPIEWSSSNESVASVFNGWVRAEGTGTAIITARANDLVAYCIVTVSIKPDPALIFSTTENSSSPVTEFVTRQEVYINVENMLKTTPLVSGTVYHVKVEERGKRGKTILGQGTVTLTNNTKTFNLYLAANHFKAASTYSATYFVSMSSDPNYPTGDATLSTNFKIGSAVPIISIENIKVTTQVNGGPLGNPDGVIFLLCRELDKPLSATTWQDYYAGVIPGKDGDPYGLGSEKVDINKFTDEVKMKGIADATGKIIWQKPVETLKIGGYVLLEVTPKGYSDNLNLVNPQSTDGELLKAVSLTRSGSIVRTVINVYSE